MNELKDRQIVRIFRIDGFMMLQDCATQLCMDRKGKFTIPAEAPLPELYPGSRQVRLFDTELDVLRVTNAMKNTQLVKGIDYENLDDLKNGQEIVYIAGQKDWHCAAIAKLTQKPGTTGCMIKIEKYLIKGSKVNIADGEEIVAGVSETFIPWTNS